MALYRTVSLSFWTDSKVIDDFTPQDKYFFLYLMTNPHTNLSGCYEISTRQIANETGYNNKMIEQLLTRFKDTLKIATYCKKTKEVLILNWHKYNWTSSEKFRKPLIKEIQSIKCEEYKKYLLDIFNGTNDTRYPIDTKCIDTECINTSVTVTVTDTDTITDSIPDKKTKHKYGEYNNVKLTDEERDKLFVGYGEAETLKAIKFLDEYIVMKGDKYKSHYMAMRKWVFDAVKRERPSEQKQSLADKWGIGNDEG